jgi:hypothetical protein
MAEAVKKNLYHSELSTLGSLRVKVKTDVMASKFKGKPPYVVLEIDGIDRNYSVENDKCQRALANLKGRTVMLEATGSREEAEITILGAGAAPAADQSKDEPPYDTEAEHVDNPPPQRPAQRAPAAQPPPQAAPAAPAAPVPPQAAGHPDNVDRVIDLKKYYARRGNALALAGLESLRAIDTFCQCAGVPIDEATKKGIAQQIAERMVETTFTTLFIAADRAGFNDEFPMNKLPELLETARQRVAAAK